MFSKRFKRPLFRPAINIGGLLDIPTGKYEQGKHGEMILNGGLSSLTGIASRPNMFKTALAIYMLAAARRSMTGTSALTYDTEGTLYPVARLNAISKNIRELSEIDWEEDEQFMFTDLSRYTGDQFFDLFKESLADKKNNEKEFTKQTPFVDNNGNNRDFSYPTLTLIDSFSKFSISNVGEMYDKHSLGDSKLNTAAMNLGRAKNMLLDQMPQLLAQTGTYCILTGHVGDIVNVEMFPTDKRQLSGLKRDTTIKGVGPAFFSLPNNVWDIIGNKALLNSSKMPMYPLDNATAIQGDSDLREITIKNLRGKNGITDLPFVLIFAQTEGFLPSLSEFHYCKEAGFGMGGNQQNYYMELCPEIKLSRTTVRKKLDEHEDLRRAVEIQSEMLQLIQFQRWTNVPEPKVLYEDLQKMGYDWEYILNHTRGYWVPLEEEATNPKKFLSTYDLIRMREGTYKPYWMDDKQKSAIKPLELAG